MPTIAPSPTSDLESEIQRLKAELQNAEALRVRPEDAAADAIRQQLKHKESELRQQWEAEAQAEQERQHATKLQALADVENDLPKAKAEVTVTCPPSLVHG
jgi:RNA polymerase-interacting CarD/CdnL/TRCF family regulator